MWANLCRVLDRSDLTEDQRFRTNEQRYANRYALWEILEQRFSEKSAAEWVDKLLAAEVPAAVVNTLDLSMNDPQVKHRNMVLALTGPDGEQLRVAGNPLKFSGEAEIRHQYPPRLGGDNREILSSLLGLSDERIDGLAQAGAFGKQKAAVSSSVTTQAAKAT
jgi:crotonobetainyl-CoA:carnitine CoA-transferase CaiB-like acyl-CoA transferase